MSASLGVDKNTGAMIDDPIAILAAIEEFTQIDVETGAALAALEAAIACEDVLEQAIAAERLQKAVARGAELAESFDLPVAEKCRGDADRIEAMRIIVYPTTARSQ
jgi:hypothetical protein